MNSKLGPDFAVYHGLSMFISSALETNASSIYMCSTNSNSCVYNDGSAFDFNYTLKREVTWNIMES